MNLRNFLIVIVILVIIAIIVFVALKYGSVTTTPSNASNGSLPSLGRGINLGNALESPSEGDWGVRLQESYFSTIAQAGFNTVRVPIKWSGHSSPVAPYTIDPNLFSRVDWVVEQAQKNNLNVILDMHNFDELLKDPVGQQPRFLALWKQISEHYQYALPNVVFELYNEPHDIEPAVWNNLIAQGLATIRVANPTRAVVVGPLVWNSFTALPDLVIPPQDKYVIVTIHFYEPFHFTHQGASWIEGSQAWLGITWTGTDEEKAFVKNSLGTAATWGKVHNRPMFIGEFGAFSAGDMDSRVRWTTEVARDAEAQGLAWSYWEFCSTFGAYDPNNNTWREPLLHALIPEK